MHQHIACINMITQQLRTNTISNENILSLYKEIHRSTFVPEAYQDFAYADLHIPLDHQQCMMTPLEEAKLLQSLNLSGHETILEIGTGTGFLTALLSRLCHHVISIDYFSSFTEQAAVNLKRIQATNVTLKTIDGYEGLPDQSPYDVIVLTSACTTLSDTLRLQVVLGGKIFALIGQAPSIHGLLYSVDHQEKWQEKLIFETKLPPLIEPYSVAEFIF